MSKLLTMSTNTDLMTTYNFIKLLALSHVNNNSYFLLSQNRFVDAYNKNIFKVHLCKENINKINGMMLHMKEYSPRFGGYGTYLDDFYLEPAARGKGLGKRMLGELCRYLLDDKQKFVKVIFNEDLKLDKFYTHLNFKNYSELDLYEGNNSDLRNILAVPDSKINKTSCSKIAEHEGLPTYETVIERESERYSFCSQVQFNSWFGFGILFNEFIGETNIVQLSDFKITANKLLEDIGWNHEEIRSLWWQIPSGHTELGQCILSCEAENVNIEHWKISYLNEEGMAELAELVGQ